MKVREISTACARVRQRHRLRCPLLPPGSTLSTIQDEMVELSNGCICCTLREDLLKEIIRYAPLCRVREAALSTLCCAGWPAWGDSTTSSSSPPVRRLLRLPHFFVCSVSYQSYCSPCKAACVASGSRFSVCADLLPLRVVCLSVTCASGISEPLPVAEAFTFGDDEGADVKDFAMVDTMVRHRVVCGCARIVTADAFPCEHSETCVCLNVLKAVLLCDCCLFCLCASGDCC